MCEPNADSVALQQLPQDWLPVLKTFKRSLTLNKLLNGAIEAAAAANNTMQEMEVAVRNAQQPVFPHLED